MKGFQKKCELMEDRQTDKVVHRDATAPIKVKQILDDC